MKPAPSLLVFTVGSGAGLGLLVWLVIGRLFGAAFSGLALGVAGAIALGLLAIGLLSSTLHLANRRNAWRAMSGWRHSWLAREAIAAITVWPLAGVWLWAAFANRLMVEWIAGLLLLVAALATVWCTAMIYACLRTVPRWHCWQTRAGYPLYALVSGGLIWWALATVDQSDRMQALERVRSLLTLLLALAAVIKFSHWKRFAERRPAAITVAQAIGVPGRARLFDAGHTGPTFLTREFGFQLDAHRAVGLRWIALALSFVLPAVLIGWPVSSSLAVGMALAAPIVCLTGLLLERWLFFAEAEHVVRLYHGAGHV